MVNKDTLEKIMTDEIYERIDYNNPQEGGIHNWWNYIPWGLKEVWDELGEESRIVASIVAGNQAGKEEWD